MATPISEKELGLLIHQMNLDSSSDADDRKSGQSSYSSNGNGWIQVENHQIIVTSPDEGKKPATICAVSPLTLLINGIPLNGATEVTEDDIITWDIKYPPLFEIKVSRDRMEASLILYSREKYTWELQDVPASDRAFIKVAPNKELVVDVVQFNHIINTLEKLGIRKHVDTAAIMAELEHPTHQPVVVARGKASTPGIDARLELFFPEQVETIFHEIGGVIDYRSHRRIPSVHEGDVIAVKHALVEGIPGYDVYGDMLPPTPAQDIIVVAKDSTEMNDKGEIIALAPGRPRLTGKKVHQFDISNAFIVEGNVDLSTGNIVFSGDVIIHGHVTDHMIIESLGNVYVHGNVYNSTITATGSILVKGNVISGQLYSGYFGVMFNRMYMVSKQLKQEMERLEIAAQLLNNEIRARKQTVRYGQVIMLLLESKFKIIPELACELLQVFASIQQVQTEQNEQLLLLLQQIIQSAQVADVFCEQTLARMRLLLEQLHSNVASMQETQVSIEMAQCQGAIIKSNGDIVVTKAGVIQSELYSAGSIAFLDEHSVCRGSQLEAMDRIVAQNVGSGSNAHCILKARTHIYVNQMHNGYVMLDNYKLNIWEKVEKQLFTMEYMLDQQKIPQQTRVTSS